MRLTTVITAKKSAQHTSAMDSVAYVFSDLMPTQKLFQAASAVLNKNVVFISRSPFMWVDKRGHWHVLYHRMFDAYGPLDPNCEFSQQKFRCLWFTLSTPSVGVGGAEDGSWKKPKSPVPRGWAGGHAFSRDGLQWSKWNRCYNTSIPLSSGGFFETNRRERPKLLFDNNTGVPTHLYSGAITDKGTYTVVAPLNVPANRHERSNK
eukprot:SAG31_NODE_198_length_20656_cov_5.167291_8_plen_206_part_00